MAARRGIMAEVLRHLSHNEGLICYQADVAQVLGISVTQVQQAVSYLSKKPEVNIVTLTPGAYRFKSTPKEVVAVSSNGKSSSTLFEKIGASKTGKIVLQDEDGELYVAEKL